MSSAVVNFIMFVHVSVRYKCPVLKCYLVCSRFSEV